jgi:hypothetical protein
MKQKILFYGNCQVGAVARFFRLNLADKFEVQLCTDCGLDTFWAEPALFAVWSKENREKQKDYVDCVLSKTKDSDIFIFQPHYGGTWLLDELKTEYLHDSVALGKKICLPDTRLMIYLLDKVCLKPYVEYAKTKVNTDEEVIDFLQKSDDPKLVEMLQQEYPLSTKYQQYRNENRYRHEENLKLYSDVINMCDYMESEFKNKTLAVSHNHMAKCYYIELLRKLYKLLNVEEENYPIRNFEFPGQGVSYIDPRQFNFFEKLFHDLAFDENFQGRLLGISDIKW